MFARKNQSFAGIAFLFATLSGGAKGQISCGDINGDGSVTVADIANVAACLSGPGVTMPTNCNGFDINSSTTTDLADIADFQRYFAFPSGWESVFSYYLSTGTVKASAIFDDGSGPALYLAGDFKALAGIQANNIAKWDGNIWSAVGEGTNAVIYALTVFDDGSGPALYAGGAFTTAGPVVANRVAKWDGSTWSAVGIGFDNFGVLALGSYQSPTGTHLYAGGDFTASGGNTVNRIARWTGTDWVDVGGGTNAIVYTLAEYDAGTGPKLYVGGAFTTVGSVPANRIAGWDGTSWAAIGSGATGTVRTMVVGNLGSGDSLFIGGDFLSAGSVFGTTRIARWDGSNWFAYGNGVGYANSSGGSVYSIGVHGDLFVGGTFAFPGRTLLRWNGSTWGPADNFVSQVSQHIATMLTHDFGDGAQLFVAGTTGTPPASWSGSSWNMIGRIPIEGVQTACTFDDGTGPAAYFGGQWGVFRWNESGPVMIGEIMNGTINSLVSFDDGSGPAMIAGGTFTSISGVAANRVAKWNGQQWQPLGLGLPIDTAYSLAVYDDGSGPSLFAIGRFQNYYLDPDGPHNVPRVTDCVMKWTGTEWVSSAYASNFCCSDVCDCPGSGCVGYCQAAAYAATAFDGYLFVGGYIRSINGQPCGTFARLSGDDWLTSPPVNPGTCYCSPTCHYPCPKAVLAFEVHDDGSGAALYSSGTAAIGRWDGQNWTGLGGGLSRVPPFTNYTDLRVARLVSFDDGTGPALFVSGNFNRAGASLLVTDGGIAKWKGDSWSVIGLGYGASTVSVLPAVNTESGPQLFAMGEELIATGLYKRDLLRWTSPSPSCPP